MKKRLLSYLFVLTAIHPVSTGHVVTITPTNVTCNGLCNGQAAATVTGGIGPFTYSWSPTGQTTATATGLCAGSYTVTVNDQSDSSTATKSIVITQPAVVTLNLSANPTTICAGQPDSLSAMAGGGITPYSYSWAPSGGLSSTTIPYPIATPTASTTYTCTVTDATGCNKVNSVAITVSASPTPTISGSSSVCAGNSVTLTASGGTTYSWSTGATTPTTTLSPTTNTAYTVTATTGGCTASATRLITVNAAPTASINGTATICSGTTTTLTASGGATYVWNTGATTPAITVLPDSSKNYIVTATSAAGCTASALKFISLTPSTNMMGHVNYSGGNLNKGNVVLFRYLASQTNFDTVQVFPLSSTGNYLFSSVTAGSYLIKVFPDSALVPKGLPTYYGNQSLWDAIPSEIVSHGCIAPDSFPDITLIEIPALATGPGKISGNITKGPGFKHSTSERTDPIPGVDVKLGKNPGGSANIVGQTHTDGTGGYTFDNLPLNATGESYVVFVDIPGLTRDSSFVVVITPAELQFLQLDYVADSVTVHYVPYSGVGIKKLNNAAVNKFSVYPNPSNGNATIEYSITADANVSLDIYNVLGVKVYAAINTDQKAGTYKYTLNARKNNLSPGIYFVSLIIDGKTSIQRIVITD